MWPNWEEILIDGKMNKQIISFSPHKNLKLQKKSRKQNIKFDLCFQLWWHIAFWGKKAMPPFLGNKDEGNSLIIQKSLNQQPRDMKNRFSFKYAKITGSIWNFQKNLIHIMLKNFN